ncbi:FUN14 family-domain-containing protein [Fennellomyces sp. T-0311]|nr:FUN14 family-domain-containing protein [Fennellomyces sp. T-0311]
MSIRVLSAAVRNTPFHHASPRSHSYFMTGRRSFVSLRQLTGPATLVGARRTFQTGAMVSVATGTIMARPLLMQKQPVVCEAAAPVQVQVTEKRQLILPGELSFGTILGLSTGYFIKKMHRMFALIIGMGFVCLQYMSHKGYITVHWDRMQAGYNRQFDDDGDGKVTHRDIQSKWRKALNLLTQNIQFKSAFLAGFYVGIRVG